VNGAAQNPSIGVVLQELGNRVTAFAPHLLAMVLVLLAGLILAGVAHVVLRWLLKAFRFDRLAANVGVSSILERAGIRRPPSNLLALLVAWSLLAAFVLLSVAVLDLPIAVDVLSRALLYLPKLFIALALLLLGALLAAFLSRTVLIAAVNAGLPSARTLAGAVRAGVLIVALTMALEYVGVGSQVILVAFTILFGGTVFAAALAFGLAGKDLARDLLQMLVTRSRGDAPGEDQRRHL
jgi:hypothetical protein